MEGTGSADYARINKEVSKNILFVNLLHVPVCADLENSFLERQQGIGIAALVIVIDHEVPAVIVSENMTEILSASVNGNGWVSET